MSKKTLMRTISEELEYINQKIDMKVIKGISYRAEAKRHKLLVSMLHDVKRMPEASQRGHSIFSFF